MAPEELPRDDNGELESYAWPGGYPIYYLCEDGGILCPDCARQAEKEGLSTPDNPQWHIVGAEVNWEDAHLNCDHCYKRIESAYGGRITMYRLSDGVADYTAETAEEAAEEIRSWYEYLWDQAPEEIPMPPMPEFPAWDGEEPLADYAARITRVAYEALNSVGNCPRNLDAVVTVEEEEEEDEE